MRVTDLDMVRQQFEPRLASREHEQLMSMIASTGSLLRGHFRLQSGLHAPYFLRFGQLAYRPEHARRIAQACASQSDVPVGREVAVIGAETSARFLATALAELIGGRSVLARVDVADRRPLPEIKQGDLTGAKHAIVVTDVITTGGSIRPLVELARAAVGDLRVLAFASIGPDDATKVLARLNARGQCLVQSTWRSSQPASCPLCVAGAPLVPGFEFN